MVDRGPVKRRVEGLVSKHYPPPTY
jgi:hypothetical protein